MSESLDDILKNYSVNWYRCPIDRSAFRQLMAKSDLHGWGQSLGHLALAAFTGALTYYLFDRQVWVAFTLALLLHGAVTSHFLHGCHELGHGTVFKTRWLNALFLRIFSLLAWWNFHEYAMSHTYHHIYTLHRRADKEVLLPAEPSLKPLYLLQLLTINLTGGFATRGLVKHMIGGSIKTALGRYSVFSNPGWLEALYANRPEARRRAVNWARFLVLFHGGFAIICIANGLWLLPILVSVAPAIANLHAYLVGAPQHCGLRDDISDFRKCVRTNTLDPVSGFLYWHMNWHLEHHMFAGVPCYNLAKLHRAVASDMPQPRILFGAWREMRQTWHRQQHDPSYQFDTPVPSPAGAEPTPNPEAASIGNLAPTELQDPAAS